MKKPSSEMKWINSSYLRIILLMKESYHFIQQKAMSFQTILFGFKCLNLSISIIECGSYARYFTKI